MINFKTRKFVNSILYPVNKLIKNISFFKLRISPEIVFKNQFPRIIFIGYSGSLKAIEKISIINNFNSSETLKFDFTQKSFDKNEKGDVIQIPKGAKHRIENIGKHKLVFVEIQTGEYFGEDDIIRIQDDYRRK